MKKQKKKSENKAAEFFGLACAEVGGHPIFAGLSRYASVCRREDYDYPKDGLCAVDQNGTVYCNPDITASPEKWMRAIAHCLLHLGMGHFKQKPRQQDWNTACDCVVERFLSDLKFGGPLDEFRDIPKISDENHLYELLEYMPRTEKSAYIDFGTMGSRADMVASKEKEKHRWFRRTTPNWSALFADGLAKAVRGAVAAATGGTEHGVSDSVYQRAKEWFISSYPLLGAVAARFKIISDPQVCIRERISVAAVRPCMSELYFNPAAKMNFEEVKFVMAHELLHAALMHGDRIKWRDPYLWNVACDFVINGWLTEMGVGERPDGLLFDDRFRGLNAESVYDVIVTDLRTYRKLATLRGTGLGDILGEPENGKPDTDLDEFYKRALAQGLQYHEEQGRGYLPGDLVEEIRAMAVPPISWDVELARWFDEYFSPVEKLRTYARVSRRQSATPDIPRPNRVVSETAMDGRTFGVVIDTSGSMDRRLLASALGSVASYAASRDVPAARVVFCDAAAYDMGYMRPDDIAGTVKVRGRGGTVLQPGVDLLGKAHDFPKEAPLLIITDGQCDKVMLYGRVHAYLLPTGASLPFVPKGKIFRM